MPPLGLVPLLQQLVRPSSTEPRTHAFPLSCPYQCTDESEILDLCCKNKCEYREWLEKKKKKKERKKKEKRKKKERKKKERERKKKGRKKENKNGQICYIQYCQEIEY